MFTGRGKLVAAVVLILVCAAAYGAIVLRQRGDLAIVAQWAPALIEPRTTESVRSRSPLPMVSIEPLASDGATAPFARELGAIRTKLADALARFDDIEVIADPLAPSADPRETVRSVYRLAISGDQNAEGATSPTVQLIDAKGGAVVWTRSFERFRAGDDLSTTVETIAQQVAPTLAQPFGVIYARELASNAGDSRYRCLLAAIEYRRTLATSQHTAIRSCLEQAIASDPNFPSAQAALAFLTLREYYAGENRDPKVLDESLRLALRAVEIKPGSARAHHVLMNALFARGDIAGALAEGERAIALNPYDMTTYIGYGLRLAFTERAADGLKVLERAAKLSPGRPPILEFALFVVTYSLGDDERAAHHASLIVSEIHPLVTVARALVAIKGGDRERAQREIDKLFSEYPAWRISPRREIERYVPAPNVVDRMIHDLSPVGFSATN